MTRTLLAVSILTALAVSACSQAVTLPTETAEPSGTPTELVEPAASPTEPPPSPTASLTPISILIPTEEPSPTPVPFTACDAFSRQQAEAAIGPLDGDPFELEYIGAGAGFLGLCIFPGQLNTASVEVYQHRDAGNARTQHLQSSSGEVVTGIGDSAYWSEAGLTLSVLRGTVTLYISMSFPDGARDQAIQLGKVAVVRIP